MGGYKHAWDDTTGKRQTRERTLFFIISWLWERGKSRERERGGGQRRSDRKGNYFKEKKREIKGKKEREREHRSNVKAIFRMKKK